MKEFVHGGDVRRLARRAGLSQDRLLDFSANINPLGPPEGLRSVVSSALSEVAAYPDPDCRALKEVIAQTYRISRDTVLVGNGSTELIYLLPQALERSRAVVPVPSYADYVTACRRAGYSVELARLRESDDFRLDYEELESTLSGDEIVFLGHPNNPTGLPLSNDRILEIASRFPGTIFIIDEAFTALSEGVTSFASDRPANVISLISLTKTYAVPGLRLGCAIADPAIARRVEALQPPWTVNSIAQAVGTVALQDEDYLVRSRRYVTERRERLTNALESIPGVTVYPAAANFLLARIDRSDMAAPALAEKTLGHGIAIRVCGNFHGLDDRFFRIAVRTETENDLLLESLRKSFRVKGSRTRARKTPAIMFQGTSSNAGKSVLTAALCRILLQDGYRVAPFKAQNMSLNSFVTREGKEMGRAQVVQAQAARLEPDVRMNPVLLKPSSDTGSQVIVMGTPAANMEVEQYVDFKPQALKSVHEAYDSLAAEYDVMVLEGAGSPGEMNLKRHDIVNMRMAEYADAPVLIVGDIDRGGVFASFIGTMETLEEWERRLTAGFVVNRFRGREELLGPALDYVERHTGRPVLGVVPFISDHGLPEEDSVTFKSGFLDKAVPLDEHVEIAVIDLPHISNFTDFDAFRIEPDVRLTIVRSPDALNRPEAVILPGSKNVPGDLAYLKRHGFDRKILDLAKGGYSEIVGICGGFQMIGTRVEDPNRIESLSPPAEGLGLLELSTVMAKEKTLTRTEGRHVASGEPLTGYEIHHGRTDAGDAVPLMRKDDGTPEGAVSPDGLCWGAYLHGIFDADGFRRWFINRLREKKGYAPLEGVCARYDLEPAFDRLAGIVRESLAMDRIYRIMGL